MAVTFTFPHKAWFKQAQPKSLCMWSVLDRVVMTPARYAQLLPSHSHTWKQSWLLTGFCLQILLCKGMVSDGPWFKIEMKPRGIKYPHCRSPSRMDSKNNPIKISCFWFRVKSNSVNITPKCQNKQIYVHREDRTGCEKAKCLFQSEKRVLWQNHYVFMNYVLTQ